MPKFNFKFSTWTLPHWATVVGSAVGGAVVSYLMTIPSADLFADLATKAGAEALAKGALLAGLAALVGVAKTLLTPDGQTLKNLSDAKKATKDDK